MALEEAAREIRIASEPVIAGIGRHVGVEIGEIGQPAVGEAAGLHGAGRVANIRWHIRADVSPNKSAWPMNVVFG